jgi:hypothetical protein
MAGRLPHGEPAPTTTTPVPVAGGAIERVRRGPAITSSHWE